MTLGGALIDQALRAWTPLVLLLVLVAAVVALGPRKRLRIPLFLTLVHVIAVVISAALTLTGSTAAEDLHLVAALTGALACVGASGALLYRGLLPRVRIEAPQIIQDVSIAGVSLVMLLAVASRNGFNLSGIVATSAVLTAVVGLSLQDTLGNILGGIALQSDESIKVGDWVKVGDVVGRVANIHWRYTAVETRNWETVVIPNSLLLKSQVTVLGRRTDEPLQLRRWVWFNVDFRFPPPDVIRAVETALLAEPIPRVAAQPAPNVQLMDFGESWARYAVRYWLTDIPHDDPTDSVVRQRVYFALSRAGMNLSIPAQALFLTQESEERRVIKQAQISARKREMIDQVDLFAGLPEADKKLLADSLQHAPFTTGEALTRQGANAHWLYIIERGECSVRVEVNGIQREVAELHAGDFMGEMSLLTGEQRSATVIAKTDVECWKLGRKDFKALLGRRPEITDDVAEVLARRQTQLDQVRENLSQEVAARKLDERKSDLAGRIKLFFGV